jgi:Response regulators consisting of a CheY-like receiver domain and a winged-helix DNA-binding domain
MRVLLVEDDLQICEVTKKYFESKGAEVVVVNDGSDALAYAESGLEGYSLVLLEPAAPGWGSPLRIGLRQCAGFP